MRNSIISRNHRLWVAILPIAVVFYGNSSCKVTERSLLPPDVEESGEDAANSSVGEASGAMSVTSGSNDPVTDYADITACLQEGARWLMRVDGEEFSRHFSKLICRYIIDLIRESPSQDPVMSLESLCEFVSRLGVKLKMRQVAMSGDMGSAINSENSPTGTRIYVVDDIGWDSQFGQNLDKGVFLIDFGKCENHSRLSALYKLLGAMSWKESYDVSKDKKELQHGGDWDMEVRRIFNSHFSPLLDRAYRFGGANVTEDMQRRFVRMVQEFSDVNGVCNVEIDAPFLRRFVSRIQVIFLMNVIRYAQADLLRLLIAAGVEVYDGVDRAMPVVDRDHRYDGIFAGALIRRPFNVRMETAELNLSVESLGWPCIFFIKRDNHVHVLGTTMAAAKNVVVSVCEGRMYETIEEGLGLSGYFKCNPRPCDGRFGGLSDPNSKWCNKCSMCLGIDSFDLIMRGDESLLYSRDRSCSCDLMSSDSNDESNIDVGKFVMKKLYGDDWSSDGVEGCKFVAVSYEDSVKFFYRDTLLASLEDLERTL